MANMNDYLKWRGDLSFEVSPFNDIDNLILSQLAYVNFEGIIPGVGSRKKIYLYQACELFFEKYREEDLKKVKTFISDAPFFMKRVAKTERFKYVVLSNYVNHIDEKAQKQFAAFHARLEDGTTYISFMGTDDTIVGWKEDFNMSFIVPVPSQIEAVNYVNGTVGRMSGKLRMGGHSKGGNLAIYAAVMSFPRIRRRIIDVYNNDGPGFDESILGMEQYIDMLPRIKTIVPEHSIVGMLLGHEEDYMVVKSSQSGIMQHDAMSWQVMGTQFNTVEQVCEDSRLLNDAFTTWISELDKQKRSQFVETLFEIITASGAKTLSDINGDFFKSAAAAFKKYGSMDQNTRAMMRQLLYSLSHEIGKARKKKLFNAKRTD